MRCGCLLVGRLLNKNLKAASSWWLSSWHSSCCAWSVPSSEAASTCSQVGQVKLCWETLVRRHRFCFKNLFWRVGICFHFVLLKNKTEEKEGNLSKSSWGLLTQEQSCTKGHRRFLYRPAPQDGLWVGLGAHSGYLLASLCLETALWCHIQHSQRESSGSPLPS